jgi:hypothetical protein
LAVAVSPALEPAARGPADPQSTSQAIAPKTPKTPAASNTPPEVDPDLRLASVIFYLSIGFSGGTLTVLTKVTGEQGVHP